MNIELSGKRALEIESPFASAGGELAGIEFRRRVGEALEDSSWRVNIEAA